MCLNFSQGDVVCVSDCMSEESGRERERERETRGFFISEWRWILEAGRGSPGVWRGAERERGGREREREMKIQMIKIA